MKWNDGNHRFNLRERINEWIFTCFHLMHPPRMAGIVGEGHRRTSMPLQHGKYYYKIFYCRFEMIRVNWCGNQHIWGTFWWQNLEHRLFFFLHSNGREVVCLGSLDSTLEPWCPWIGIVPIGITNLRLCAHIAERWLSYCLQFVLNVLGDDWDGWRSGEGGLVRE